MLAVIQRVREARVCIDDQTVGAIGQGLVILLGVETEDGKDDEAWLTGKIARMRIFGDEAGLMNRSLQEIGGEALVISQFTLQASTKKGNRPSFLKAARPDVAMPLYEAFIAGMRHLLGESKVATGQFGADMQIHLVNDGPVTIVIDSKNRQ